VPLLVFCRFGDVRAETSVYDLFKRDAKSLYLLADTLVAELQSIVRAYMQLWGVGSSIRGASFQGDLVCDAQLRASCTG
jgi:hypothetical protein